MLEELRNAARRVQGERGLRDLMSHCKRLLSERGEANSVAIARDLVARFAALPDDQQSVFFDRLSHDFSPDPKAVLQSAQAYANEPSVPNLLRLCAFYLGQHSAAPGGDPVARFHLDNGARLERLNALGDLSAKGCKQSFGLMVNYLYDLDKVEAHHEKFTQGDVAQSRALAALL